MAWFCNQCVLQVVCLHNVSMATAMQEALPSTGIRLLKGSCSHARSRRPWWWNAVTWFYGFPCILKVVVCCNFSSKRTWEICCPCKSFGMLSWYLTKPVTGETLRWIVRELTLLVYSIIQGKKCLNCVNWLNSRFPSMALWGPTVPQWSSQIVIADLVEQCRHHLTVKCCC